MILNSVRIVISTGSAPFASVLEIFLRMNRMIHVLITRQTLFSSRTRRNRSGRSRVPRASNKTKTGRRFKLWVRQHVMPFLQLHFSLTFSPILSFVFSSFFWGSWQLFFFRKYHISVQLQAPPSFSVCGHRSQTRCRHRGVELEDSSSPLWKSGGMELPSQKQGPPRYARKLPKPIGGEANQWNHLRSRTMNSWRPHRASTDAMRAPAIHEETTFPDIPDGFHDKSLISQPRPEKPETQQPKSLGRLKILFHHSCSQNGQDPPLHLFLCLSCLCSLRQTGKVFL